MTEKLKTGRVARVNGPAPRVGAPAASEDTTAPRVVKVTPRVHLQRTRRNNPMPTIIKEMVKKQEAPKFSSEEYYAKLRQKRKPEKKKKRGKNSQQKKKRAINSMIRQVLTQIDPTPVPS